MFSNGSYSSNVVLHWLNIIINCINTIHNLNTNYSLAHTDLLYSVVPQPHSTWTSPGILGVKLRSRRSVLTFHRKATGSHTCCKSLCCCQSKASGIRDHCGKLSDKTAFKEHCCHKQIMFDVLRQLFCWGTLHFIGKYGIFLLLLSVYVHLSFFESVSRSTNFRSPGDLVCVCDCVSVLRKRADGPSWAIFLSALSKTDPWSKRRRLKHLGIPQSTRAQITEYKI